MALGAAIVAALLGLSTIATAEFLVFLIIPWLAFIGHLNLTSSLSPEEKTIWRRELWWSHRSIVAVWAYLFANDLAERTKGSDGTRLGHNDGMQRTRYHQICYLWRPVRAADAWALDFKEVMNQLTCCKKSSWVSELDLGHAAGFEYMLGKCDRCGTYWMNVFCVASGITGFEPVSLTDVERMKSIPTGPEQKAFMRGWGEKNI